MKKFKNVAEKPNLKEATGKIKKQLEKRPNIKVIWWRKKSQKSWTVSHVMYGGGVQVGPPEMPEMHQPSTFSGKITISISMCHICVLYKRGFCTVLGFRPGELLSFVLRSYIGLMPFWSQRCREERGRVFVWPKNKNDVFML